MNSHQKCGILHVADRASGDLLFSQSLGEWFEQTLIGRAVWAAAHTVPASRGVRVEANLEVKMADDDRVVGWSVVLSSADTLIYRRSWSADVLRATAATVARQCRGTNGDGRVLYWVSGGEADADRAAQTTCGGIDFRAGGDRCVRVPAIATRPTALTGQVVAPAAAYPTKIVLELSVEAHAELAAAISDQRLVDKEVAWAGQARIVRAADHDTVVYQVHRLERLATPEASAALCPISPDHLVDLLQDDAPIVFMHTHVTAADDTQTGAGDARLACSEDDLRCFYRLSVGSLGVVVASRPPLRVRAYGWPTDGDGLTEMSTTVTLLRPA